MHTLKLANAMLFLSTLSLRRATERVNSMLTLIQFLSTLSLRRATDMTIDCLRAFRISIHALLAESDYDTSSLMQCQAKFLSTLSLRRATVYFA